VNAEVPSDCVEILRELYARARTVRGWTPVDHPDRRTSVLLSELLADLSERCGLSLPTLDAAMGARPGTTRRRLQRHGYRKLPPSNADHRYTGAGLTRRKHSPTGPRVDLTGRRFHDLTAVRWTGESSPLGAVWEWGCTCGRARQAVGAQVKAGKVKRCTVCAQSVRPGPPRTRR
jgi:hypothetical protein